MRKVHARCVAVQVDFKPFPAYQAYDVDPLGNRPSNDVEFSFGMNRGAFSIVLAFQSDLQPDFIALKVSKLEFN